MKVSEILSTAVKPFPSIEIVPPLRGITKDELLENIAPFMEFKPRYINVTSHRDEYEFRPEADGSFTRHLVRNRINEATVCAAIMSRFDVETVPHLICGGSTCEEIESKLDNLEFMGITNIMALRGDSLIGEKRFTPEPGGFRYAGELVRHIREYQGNGKFRNPERHFCIGVGAYPEKHFEAPNLETDILHLKEKVDAGADYIITQMFFDNERFYQFIRQCREAGIHCPIIPGLKPLSTAKQVNMLPEAFSLDLPVELTQEISRHAQDKAAVYQIGQEWCTMQCRDLIAHGVPAVHFYTMGKPDNVTNILRACF